MKKLTSKKAAKKLDFENESDFFNYLIDSYLCGNFSQCRRLFSELTKQAQKEFLKFFAYNCRHAERTECYQFYLECL